MASKKSSQSVNSLKAVNPLESLKTISGSIGTNTVDSLKSIGGGIFDQLLGIENHEQDEKSETVEQQIETVKKENKRMKKEANLFSYQNHHETVVVKEQIKQLVQIDSEVFDLFCYFWSQFVVMF